MPQLYIPDPRSDDQAATLAWWLAMKPATRLVFLQALWETEGCERPEELEPHQKGRAVRAGDVVGAIVWGGKGKPARYDGDE